MTTRTPENTLVIDDVRTMKFASTIVRRLEPAFGVLYSQPWNEVWLDHDLEFALSKEEIQKFFYYNIRPLVTRIVEDAEKGIKLPVGKFIVHSVNQYGGDWMMAQLLPHYPNTARVDVSNWVKHEAWPSWTYSAGNWAENWYEE